MSDTVGAIGKSSKPRRPKILRWVEWGFIALMLLILILSTGFPHELFTRSLTRYPDSWATIRPGMTSTEARAILGEPTADGRHLKSVDRWIITRKGVSMHLDLWFHDAGEHTTIARISRYKRFWGRNTEKKAF